MASETAPWILMEDLVEPEWCDWYRLTPEQRWQETTRLWEQYLALGGSLEPDVDTESPFWSEAELAEFAVASRRASAEWQCPRGV